MPVEQISGLPVAARLESRAWLVKSAEATLKPSIPQRLSLSRLASSQGVQSGTRPLLAAWSKQRNSSSSLS